jgi:hypothetical protein
MAGATMIHSAKSANKAMSKSAVSVGASRRSTRVHASAREDAQEPQVQRRALLSSLSVALPLMGASPSLASYGEAANVFGGKTGNFSGFTPYEGDGYSLQLPAKWNPSKEKIFPGTDLRYEDNFDAVNNIEVIIKQGGSLGSPQDFLNSISYLLGESSTQNFESQSEGGFKPNKVAAASVLSAGTRQDKNGKTYNVYELLTRTADGNEGGRHHLIAAAVSKGNLYIFRAQAGDKRWIGVGKGVKNECLGAWESFTVA